MDATWLHSRGKHQYEPAFRSKATDAAVLPDRRREEPRALAILVRYRPGRRPTIECRVMFCEIVGSIALAGALDPEDFARRNRPISLPATDDRRSRWRVSSPKYVGRPRASLRQQV